MMFLQRTFKAWATAIIISMLSLPLHGQTFEQDYLATKERLIQRLNLLPSQCLAPNNPDGIAQGMADDLRKRLESRLGSSPTSMALKPGEATQPWECTLGAAHLLDALAYEMKDGSGFVTRTTPGLLRAWAARQRQGEGVDDPPGQWVDGLPRNGEWYMWAVLGDAVGLVAAEIPVQPVKAGTHALAYLVAHSQGFFAGQPPYLVLAIVTNGDLVSFAWTEVSVFDNDAACRSQLAPFDPSTDWAPRRAARQVYATCWSAALQASPGRLALAARAQMLVEALE